MDIRRPGGQWPQGYRCIALRNCGVLVGFCDLGTLAVVAIVLGATHRRRVGRGGPGRRQALTGLLLGAVVVLPSLVLSIGFHLPQPPH